MKSMIPDPYKIAPPLVNYGLKFPSFRTRRYYGRYDLSSVNIS